MREAFQTEIMAGGKMVELLEGEIGFKPKYTKEQKQENLASIRGSMRRIAKMCEVNERSPYHFTLMFHTNQRRELYPTCLGMANGQTTQYFDLLGLIGAMENIAHHEAEPDEDDFDVIDDEI